jgi:hypothetical protein
METRKIDTLSKHSKRGFSYSSPSVILCTWRELNWKVYCKFKEHKSEPLSIIFLQPWYAEKKKSFVCYVHDSRLLCLQ